MVAAIRKRRVFVMCFFSNSFILNALLGSFVPKFYALNGSQALAKAIGLL
jgi:hypothetical protein